MSFSQFATVGVHSAADAWHSTKSLTKKEQSVLFDGLQMAIRDTFELGELEETALRVIAARLNKEARK